MLLKSALYCRKRSHSVSSSSSSGGSYDGSRSHRKKSKGRSKMDEVDRLAEMERQRRVREAEQKVSFTLPLILVNFLSKHIIFPSNSQ